MQSLVPLCNLTILIFSKSLYKMGIVISYPFSQGQLWSKNDMKNVNMLSKLQTLSKCQTFLSQSQESISTQLQDAVFFLNLCYSSTVRSNYNSFSW